jgi:hypothetical protein
MVRLQPEALPGEQLRERPILELRDALDEEPALFLRASLQAFEQ